MKFCKRFNQTFLFYLFKTTTIYNYSHILYLRRCINDCFEKLSVCLMFLQYRSAHIFQMTPASRITASSKPVLFQREKFKKGKITADDNPKAVWLSSAKFLSYKLDTFCTTFNKFKSEELGDDGKYSTF